MALIPNIANVYNMQIYFTSIDIVHLHLLFSFEIIIIDKSLYIKTRGFRNIWLKKKKTILL